MEATVTMKRILASATLCVIVTGAIAMPSFLTVFKDTYKISSSSTLGKAKCLICHTSMAGKKMNAYGADLKTALGSKKKMTAEILAKVEGLDSAKTGSTNLAKIRADKLPGK